MVSTWLDSGDKGADGVEKCDLVDILDLRLQEGRRDLVSVALISLTLVS